VQSAADHGHSTTRAVLDQYLDWLRTRPASDCIIVADVQTVMSASRPTACQTPVGAGDTTAAEVNTEDARSAHTNTDGDTNGDDSADEVTTSEVSTKAVTTDALDAGGGTPLYVSLTFDDGLRGDFTEALPSLVSHGYEATFYINSGAIGPAKRIASRTG
jgi:hypothetical protein